MSVYSFPDGSHLGPQADLSQNQESVNSRIQVVVPPKKNWDSTQKNADVMGFFSLIVDAAFSW